MMLRIATFNLENLDDQPKKKPSLDDRIALMRPQLERLRADILCLQEVHGQETPGKPRRLLALNRLLEGTQYADFFRASTQTTTSSQVYDKRNLVILSRYPIVQHRQYKHDYAPAPSYRKVTAQPPDVEADEVSWERPILHASINVQGRVVEVLNLHLKSRMPTPIPGQTIGRYGWKHASGWAEGYFLSSMKRVGQALEARMLVDTLFDQNEGALLVVCGDFNADADSVPLQAIRGDVESTGSAQLSGRVLVPCERTVPGSARYSFLYRGKKEMLDHLLISRGLLAYYAGAEIHNELLHDESVGSATDKKYPESDHAPVIASFLMPESP